MILNYYIINSRDCINGWNYCMICVENEANINNFHYLFYFLSVGRMKKLVSKKFIETSINLLPATRWLYTGERIELTTSKMDDLFREWYFTHVNKFIHCIRKII